MCDEPREDDTRPGIGQAFCNVDSGWLMPSHVDTESDG